MADAVGRLRFLAGRVPATGWLAAIVALSLLVRLWLARGMLAPFVMPDELIYAELSRSFADTGSFAIRDVAASGYPILYPVAVSPAFFLFDGLTDAYAAVKAINALLMSLAAIPAYFLARRVAPAPLALLASVLTVAVPGMAYTGLVMTENLFYPVSLTVALLTVRMLERPSVMRSVVLLAGLVVAIETRTQALVLAIAVATAPLVAVLLRREGIRQLFDFRRFFAILAGVVLGLVALQAARGGSLQDILGAYSVVGDETYDTGLALRMWGWHVELLVLATGVVPVIAFLILLARAWTLPRALQDQLAVTIVFAAWGTLSVAVFASRFAVPQRILERSMFFLIPLFVVALVAWVARGAPRPRAVAVPAAAIAVTLAGVFPFRRFIDTPVKGDTFSLVAVWNQFDSLVGGSIEWSIILLACLGALALLLVPRRLGWGVPILLLVAYGLVSHTVWAGPYGVKQSGAGALFQGIRAVPRDWVDRAVPAGSDVTFVFAGLERFRVNQAEFFNRRVGEVVYVDVEPELGGTVLGSRHVAIDDRTGVVRRDDGTVVDTEFALVDGPLEPDGRLVGRDELTGVSLWRIGGVLHIAKTAVEGLYEDLWSAPELIWRHERCRGGTLTVTLSGDARLFPAGQVVAAAGRSVRVPPPPAGPVTFRVPATPVHGVCTIRFRVAPTARPSVVVGGNDTRELGTHFTAFSYEPATAPKPES
ncbi:MAG: hypothetical protein FJW96_05045 [Actinobacteria bacterium]|nr:hypothetical protein [Actinomycetota bacterium]